MAAFGDILDDLEATLSAELLLGTRTVEVSPEILAWLKMPESGGLGQAALPAGRVPVVEVREAGRARSPSAPPSALRPQPSALRSPLSATNPPLSALFVSAVPNLTAGPASELFWKMVAAMKLSREQVATFALCDDPRAVTLTEAQLVAGAKALADLVRTNAPRAIVAFGAMAQRALLLADSTATAVEGSWFKFQGVNAISAVHPAQVVRQEKLGDEATVRTLKRRIWNSLKKVVLLLGAGS